MPEFIKRLSCSSCHWKIPLFNHLTDDELCMMDANRHEVSFNTGEIILKQGAPLTHIVCLTRGLANIYIEGLRKRKLILRILKPTEIASGPGLFVDNKLHYSVRAITDCYACLIDIEAFNKTIIQNNQFAFELLRMINKQMIENFDRMVTLTMKQMPGRLAETLLYLSNHVYGTDSFHTELSRQDIADLSAMTKESAIRIIKEFKDSGILAVEGLDFSILNKEKLISISITG